MSTIKEPRSAIRRAGFSFCLIQRLFGPVALGLALTQVACTGFVRAQGGGAFDATSNQNRSGGFGAIDVAGVPSGIKWFDGKPIPVALHTSVDGIFAENSAVFGWGTGLAYIPPPRPLSPYFLGGTSAHIGKRDDKLFLGFTSPYAEIGVRSLLSTDPPDGVANRWFLTMGVAGASYANFLGPIRELADGFVLLKFGVGWGHE